MLFSGFFRVEILPQSVVSNLEHQVSDYAGKFRCAVDDEVVFHHEVHHVFLAHQNAESVFCFVGALHEPDTMPILQGALSAGKQLLVPRIAGPGQMQLVPLQSLEQLQPGAFGILEPGQALPAVPAGSGVQLAVLPCLAAARSGARLGHGGGYYDRFLANYSGRRLILCPEALLAQSLPTGPLDEPAQAVLTEKALYGTL